MQKFPVMLFSLALILAFGRGLAQETPLTNQDVVKLASLGLGDEVVIAKINQAKTVDFKLGTDDLVSLKKSGVSSAVIEAMLKRASPPTPSPAYQPPPMVGTASQIAMPQADVRLKTTGGDLSLKLIGGEVSTTGFGFVTFVYMNYPGLHAKVRTSDRRPTVLVKSELAPTKRIWVVRLDVNDDSDDRSLKIGSARENPFRSQAMGKPDPSWTFDYEASEESPNMWRLSLKKDLKPGEYGLYMDLPGMTVGSRFYDFGVD